MRIHLDPGSGSDADSRYLCKKALLLLLFQFFQLREKGKKSCKHPNREVARIIEILFAKYFLIFRWKVLNSTKHYCYDSVC